MPTPEEQITEEIKNWTGLMDGYKTEAESQVKIVDGLVKTNSETKVKLEKMEVDLAASEAKHATYVEDAKTIADANAKRDEYLNAIEAKLQRTTTGNATKFNPEDFFHKTLYDGACAENADEVKTVFEKYLRQDKQGMTAEEMKVLTLGDATTGGYLAYPELVNKIIKEARDITPVMQLAKTQTTSANTVQMPRKTGTVTCVKRGESEAKTATTGYAVTMETIQLAEGYCFDDITTQNLEDSAFDLESELKEEFRDAFAAKMGTEFISGTGPLQLEGIAVNATLQDAATSSGHATELMPGTLVTFMDSYLKPQFNRSKTLLFTKETRAAIRILSNSTGNYHWAPGFDATPGELAGINYVICVDMPAIGAGLYPIAMGDFKQGYRFASKPKVTMKRIEDTVTDAAGTVRISGTMRWGGIIVLTNAIGLYKVAA